MGAAVTCLRVLLAMLVWCWAPCAAAADRYALIVGGASGGPEFAVRYDYWRTTIAGVLGARYGYSGTHVIQLAERAQGAVRQATRENVRAALADLARRATSEDIVLILLIGHGTATDAEDAKFNLVGPDMSAAEWASVVRPITGRLVFINAASGSYPFLQKLSASGRVVITAADTMSQQSDALFPEFFFGALIAVVADHGDAGLREESREALRTGAARRVAHRAGPRHRRTRRGARAVRRPRAGRHPDGR